MCSHRFEIPWEAAQPREAIPCADSACLSRCIWTSRVSSRTSQRISWDISRGRLICHRWKWRLTNPGVLYTLIRSSRGSAGFPTQRKQMVGRWSSEWIRTDAMGLRRAIWSSVSSSCRFDRVSVTTSGPRQWHCRCFSFHNSQRARLNFLHLQSYFLQNERGRHAIISHFVACKGSTIFHPLVIQILITSLLPSARYWLQDTHTSDLIHRLRLFRRQFIQTPGIDQPTHGARKCYQPFLG